MKNRIPFALFLFCTLGKSLSQANLVPNPSFESYSICPVSSGEISKAIGWTSFCNTPDYFNICNQFDWGVPKNICGFQNPASGSAYAGFVSYSDFPTGAREYVGCSLVSPLVIGTKYYLSFKVALTLENAANPANCASNKLGAMFSTAFFPCKITNSPPIYSDIIITDSLNWTRISGSFLADSAYTHLMIGNFFDNTSTDTLKYFNSWWSDFAYYYLDDVCLGTDSLFVNNFGSNTFITEASLETKINLYPVPVTDYLTIECHTNCLMEIEVFDVIGELLVEMREISKHKVLINLADIQKGILIIRIKSNTETINYKIFKY